MLGNFVLGAVSMDDAPGFIPPAPLLPNPPGAYLGHLFSNDGLTFKKNLEFIVRPVLKYTLNAGYHELDLEVATVDTSSQGPAVGDLMKLTTKGSTEIIYVGIVEDLSDEISSDGVHHHIVLAPLMVELGDAYFNQQYTTLTDIAQMVRDAIRTTNHCSYTPMSLPDTGVQAVYNFNNTTALDVLNTCRAIAGLNYYFFVDATGVVYFQPINLTAPAAYTLKRGTDYNARRRSAPLSQLRNKVVALGGYVRGAATPITATYSNATSQKQYGTRALNPPLVFPTLSDQATLDRIVATYGAIFDRLQVRGELTIPNLGQRIDFRRQGGPTLRYWEPTRDPFAESGTGTGQYSANYVALDVEIDGSQQRVAFSDIGVTGIQDIQHQIDTMIQRSTMASLAQPTFIGTP
jgi:hypothetical protein